MSELDLSSGVQSWPPLDKHLESELDLSSGVQSWPLLDKHPENELDLSSGVQSWPPPGKFPGAPAGNSVGFGERFHPTKQAAYHPAGHYVRPWERMSLTWWLTIR